MSGGSRGHGQNCPSEHFMIFFFPPHFEFIHIVSNSNLILSLNDSQMCGHLEVVVQVCAAGTVMVTNEAPRKDQTHI